MQIYPFNFPSLLGVNAYLVADEATGSAALIDCGRGYKKIADFAAEKGFKVEKVLLTHGHFDHVMEAAKWKVAGAEIFIHEADNELMKSGGAPDGFFGGAPKFAAGADVLLRGGESISVGNITFSVIHTPGHSRGSVCYLTDGAIFTGDTLFKGSFGRYDFPGGDKHELKDSLETLFALPGAENIVVYPGHDQPTNLHYEALTNPGRYCLDDQF